MSALFGESEPGDDVRMGGREGGDEEVPVGVVMVMIVAKMMSMSSLPSGAQVSWEQTAGKVGRTDSLTAERVCEVAEEELADYRAYVRTSFDEPFEVGRQGVTTVEAVLEHGRNGLQIDM